MIGIVGKKCGMTRVFTDDGRSVPVTIVQANPNFINKIKTKSTDGYDAIQVTTGQKIKRLSKPNQGQIKSTKKHIITFKTEHKAVLDICEFLENSGFEITYLSVKNNGLIDLKKLKSAIRKDTLLISVLHANNEIGVPIDE